MIAGTLSHIFWQSVPCMVSLDAMAFICFRNECLRLTCCRREISLLCVPPLCFAFDRDASLTVEQIDMLYKCPLLELPSSVRHTSAIDAEALHCIWDPYRT